MFEELIIWGPQVADEHDTLAELSEKDRAYLAKELEGLDDKWGISSNKTSYVNSYQNDDYLFVAGLLQEVMMNCEINADWTAALWMLNELL